MAEVENKTNKPKHPRLKGFIIGISCSVLAAGLFVGLYFLGRKIFGG